MTLVVFREFCSDLEMIWKKIEPSSQYHTFQSYEWLKFWQKTIGDCVLGVKPWIAVVLNSDDQPMMIFPFGVRRSLGARILEFLGGGQGDYQGPLIHNNWISDPPNVRSAWNMVRKSLPGHDIRHFIKLPAQWCIEDNPMLDLWENTFQDNSYSAQLPNSFSEYQLKLRPKLKADNIRQRKRLSEKGAVKFEVLDSDNNDRLAALNVMIEQKRQRCRSMGVPDMFSDEMVRCFYKELPSKFANEGRVHFSVLKLDDEVLATHWGAVYRERFYFLIPTFSGEKWGAFSPGRLLLENLLEWSIQNGLKEFDFTIGGEDYKKHWCDSEMPLFEHLQLVTPWGLPYIVYVRLRRRARKSPRIWGGIKLLYSALKYGRHNEKKH